MVWVYSNDIFSLPASPHNVFTFDPPPYTPKMLPLLFSTTREPGGILRADTSLVISRSPVTVFPRVQSWDWALKLSFPGSLPPTQWIQISAVGATSSASTFELARSSLEFEKSLPFSSSELRAMMMESLKDVCRLSCADVCMISFKGSGFFPLGHFEVLQNWTS